MLAPHRFDTAHMITFILVGCLWLAWKLGQREKWLGWTYTALIVGTGVNLFTNRTVLLHLPVGGEAECVRLIFVGEIHCFHRGHERDTGRDTGLRR